MTVDLYFDTYFQQDNAPPCSKARIMSEWLVEHDSLLVLLNCMTFNDLSTFTGLIPTFEAKSICSDKNNSVLNSLLFYLGTDNVLIKIIHPWRLYQGEKEGAQQVYGGVWL
ncbi:hypothetical protein GOODEAATRI_005882 [Goodea atripinnis]|uniref:Uncharacterized protein n=1 Tax=Goodea atripinnis TaxID=208336 RepID=A0ABV0PL95_9TELE